MMNKTCEDAKTCVKVESVVDCAINFVHHIGNRENIMEQFNKQAYFPGRKKVRMAAYPDVEEALLKWFKAAWAA